MDSTIQARLKALEDSISRLEFQQDSCRPLLKLTRDSQCLGRIEETMAAFSKQRTDIDHEIKANQNAIEELTDTLEASKSQSAAQIANEAKRREDVMKEMNTKLAQVDNGFKSLEKQNADAIKEIETKLKSEIAGLVDNIKLRLKDERQTIKNALQESKTEVEKDLKEIRDKTAQSEAVIEDFEKRYSGIVNPANSRDRVKGQADLRMTLVSEITAKINESVEECKKQFENKFQTLQTKYNQELQRIRSQMEEMRNWASFQK
ncbi:unnamed protein product [Blepharisma stoltei]|uniref:Uncharacterized protein n=1 Tax=Blepharisma stoltei TaxID=1481888 RepID=A0AAU9JBM8_9CILI|nr:unnamed protein product [Blepharisma stoltei]